MLSDISAHYACHLAWPVAVNHSHTKKLAQHKLRLMLLPCMCVHCKGYTTT